MVILGIETSCDETAVGILDITISQEQIHIHPLTNIVASQIPVHRPFGGVVPMLASREHLENIKIVLQKSLIRAFGSVKAIHNIDAFAVTKGPGLIPALLIGTNFAKSLACLYDKPLIGVNHMEGHLLSFLLPEKSENFQFPISNFQKIFPAIILLVSGGHTQLIFAKEVGNYKVIGDTRDDAAGECFDKGARILGLDYPGGPAIAAEAAKYKIQNTCLRRQAKYKIQGLPRPMLNSPNLDFSFSGLKTALLYLTEEIGENNIKKYRSQLAFELQEAITDVLVSKTLKAANLFPSKSIIIGGGVSANKRLRDKLVKAMKTDHLSQKLLLPRLEYTGDNAIMIALAGFFRYQARPNFRWNWKDIRADANYSLSNFNQMQ